MAYHTFEEEEGCEIAVLPSLLATLAGSVNSNFFRNLYRRMPNGQLHDVIDDGDLACATTVSTWIDGVGLLKGGQHTTVRETLKDMKASGWLQCQRPGAGRVVLWEERLGDDGRPHLHTGICINNQVAVSNFPGKKQPVAHPIEGFYTHLDGTVRKVECYYKHPVLEADRATYSVQLIRDRWQLVIPEHLQYRPE